MRILTRCTNSACGTTFKVDEEHVGRKVTCPKCRKPFVIAAAGVPKAAKPVARQPHSADESTQAAYNSAEMVTVPSFATVPASNVHETFGQTPTGPEAESDIPAIWNVGDVILDTYEVKKLSDTKDFAEGGFGRVYRVHHKGWNLDLAVKSPRPEFFHDERQKENFEHECEAWIELGLHPHIVSCHYVRRLGGIPRVFAEYMDGGSLSDLIVHQEDEVRKLYENGHDTALKRILDIAIQFAWGLHYAHEKGLIHQDVKPHNVMLTTDGTAKVTDFGLARARAANNEARATDGKQSLLVTTGGQTPAYCSPEQANREKLNRKDPRKNKLSNFVMSLYAGRPMIGGAGCYHG